MRDPFCLACQNRVLVDCVPINTGVNTALQICPGHFIIHRFSRFLSEKLGKFMKELFMGILQDTPTIDVSWLMGRSATLPHRSLLRKLFPNRILFALALVVTVLWLPPLAFGAQTLDQAVQAQLDLDCLGLT